MGESGAQQHVLFFHDVAGGSRVERLPSLADAVRRVEELANDEGVTDCELFALHAVPLQRQQRWHVAVAGLDDPAAVPAPSLTAPFPASFHASVPASATLPAAAPSAIPTTPAPTIPPARSAADHLDTAVVDDLDVEVVDEVFHEVLQEVGQVAEPGVGGDAAESSESADVLPPAPRGRGLGFFVHQ